MDPGNWITSIAGGAQFKYSLLSVILISSLIAMLLQSMAARLGIVTGKDLAQLTREEPVDNGNHSLVNYRISNYGHGTLRKLLVPELLSNYYLTFR
ncbi:Manganese transport protein MntH [Levilactobacillus brevis]|nr:Manganese transport protein MntH [Levilactobacillus brevis]